MATPSARSWLRPTPGAHRTDRALPAVLLGCSLAFTCSQGAPPAHIDEPAPVIVPARVALSADDLAGYWKWSMVSEEDGIRRVEVETWHFQPVEQSTTDAPPGSALDSAPDSTPDSAPDSPPDSTPDSTPDRPVVPKTQLTGTCERSVTFMSLSGMPFSCNQALHYRLHASYRIEADIVAENRAVIKERDFQVQPSPCERGRRRLTSYDAQLTESGDLQMQWPNGKQMLRRIQPPARPSTSAPPPTSPPTSPSASPSGTGPDSAAKSTLTGTWRWHSRNQKDGEVRVESEVWHLREEPATGALNGTIERTVTIFAEQGTRYSCAGDTHYSYRDKYTVRGGRQGPDLTISEVAVEPEKHACLDYHERHLDAAIGSVVGSLVGEYVTLTWRGGKRQVLQRAPSWSSAVR